jgi:hypothetical protein
MKQLHRLAFRYLFIVGAVAATTVGMTAAEGKKPSPIGKIYFSDVSGEAMLNNGESVHDVTRRSVYPAQGSVVETKKPQNAQEGARYFSTAVYSNGTGAFFDADTRVELKRFTQEPFTPNRTDVEVEPSISQTQAYVTRGIVGLCTSKLVAGSNMTYQTPHGAVSVRGRRLVIEATQDVTKISMLDGESTIRAGAMDLAGQTLKGGQQAVIRRRGVGEANEITITDIPKNETPMLEEKVSMACMARRTVYFDVQSAVAGFNGTSAEAERELVAVEVLAPSLPLEYTISPSRIEPDGTGPGS